MKIYLIRHGMTILNEKRAYSGSGNLFLSDKGISDLKRIKDKISYPSPRESIYLSSPMNRCIQTMNFLFSNPKINAYIKEFREIDFGDFEGKNYEQLKDLPDYRKWIMNYEQIAPPNGERYSDFKERVIRAYREVINRYNSKTVIIVTHGGVIRLIMHHFIDSSIPFYEWEVPFGLGYIIDKQTNDYKKIKEGGRKI